MTIDMHKTIVVDMQRVLLRELTRAEEPAAQIGWLCVGLISEANQISDDVMGRNVMNAKWMFNIYRNNMGGERPYKRKDVVWIPSIAQDLKQLILNQVHFGNRGHCRPTATEQAIREAF